MEIIIFVLLLIAGTEGLATCLSTVSADSSWWRGCGLFLAVFMTVIGFTMWADPKLLDGYILMFFASAGFGVWRWSRRPRIAEGSHRHRCRHFSVPSQAGKVCSWSADKRCPRSRRLIAKT